MRYDAERGGREWAREWARERERERLWTVRSHIHVLNGITHGPLHTRPECRNLRSTSEGWRRQRSTLYLNGNERDFWKIVKKSGMDVRSWNFFYVKIQPSSKCEKISASYVHFWFFYNFSKIGTEIFFTFRRELYLDVKKFQHRTSIPDFFTIFQRSRSFPLKYTVERRVISFCSSTEDFTFQPCVKWAVNYACGGKPWLSKCHLFIWFDFILL